MRIFFVYLSKCDKMLASKCKSFILRAILKCEKILCAKKGVFCEMRKGNLTEKIQKLYRAKSPDLKKIVIGLGLVSAFGAGYQLNEARWQALSAQKDKTQNMQKNACSQTAKTATFRVDEFTPEGVKIAELNAIDNLGLVNPDSAKFLAYKTDSLNPANVAKIAKQKNNKGEVVADELSFGEIEKMKNNLALAMGACDTLKGENFLKAKKQYYDLVCMEIYKCAKYGANPDLWHKDDQQLRLTVLKKVGLMNVRMNVLKKLKTKSAYPKEEFIRDFYRARMAESLRQERKVRKEINDSVNSLIIASNQVAKKALKSKKDSLKKALYIAAENKQKMQADSLIKSFCFRNLKNSRWGQ